MRWCFALLFLSYLPELPAQTADLETFRFEVTASAWHTHASGQVQAGAFPIDLRSDLNLADRFTFLGHLTIKPALRHRILVEGSPFEFTGRNLLARAVEYGGTVYSVQQTLASKAELTYLYGGYQYDLLSRTQGHLGVQAGVAYLDANGTLRGEETGITATKSQRIGIPLVGAEFRTFLLPGRRLLNVNADVKGMPLGDYGHYVQAVAQVGVSFGRLTIQGGYGILDAEVYENTNNPVRSGISLRVTGPVISLQVRDR